MAGVVLGVESVPDGLAGGLLAGVNPVYGLNAYLFGTISGAVATSSSFMAVQATGAMAIVVADVGVVHSAEDPGKALFTLAMVTGVIMLVFGLLRLGSVLRFVSNAVMVGFISAVGVNIVLGQLDNLTGYEADGANRVLRAFDLLGNLGSVHLQTVIVGFTTMALILLLERTRLGPLGMVVAVIVGSAMAPLLDWQVARLKDVADVPNGLPLPGLPDLGLVPALIVPAAALAFVGLVQGAAITTSFPKDDGTYPDASRDFVGQGVGNLVSGLFQGMPVGGSMSASSLTRAAGAKTRLALIIGGVVMATVILVFGQAVEDVAMAALAGLLIVVGIRTIKPRQLRTVWKTGVVQATVMTVTLVLTLLIPLQYAVLVGVGISIVLRVIRESTQLTMRRLVLEPGRLREEDPPLVIAADQVVVLQPYGSLFFASASVFEDQLPEVTDGTRNSVVIVRLRGMTDLGSTLMEVLKRYASSLTSADCRLMLLSDQERVRDQFVVAGVVGVVGPENIYTSDEWVGKTLRRAYGDALAWVGGETPPSDDETAPGAGT